jgi:hypothetical protein
MYYREQVEVVYVRVEIWCGLQIIVRSYKIE